MQFTPPRLLLAPLLIFLAGAAPAPAQAPGDAPDGAVPATIMDLAAHPGSIQLGPLPGRGARAAGARSALLGGPCGMVADRTIFTGTAPEGDTPMAAAFTPDGAKIVIAHRDSRNLILIDAATRAFLMEIPISGSPNDLAISADGVHAVTANLFEDSASIVDLVAGAEIAVVPVGDQPGVVRISPDGLLAVVGNTIDQNLSVIEIATATELRRIAGAGFVSVVRLTGEPGVVTADFSKFEFAGNDTVIHGDYYNDTIDFFDLNLGTVTSVPSLADPRELAVTPDGTRAVVAHFLGVQQISVVDVPGRTILTTISTGNDNYFGLAIKPDGSKAVAGILNAAVVVNLVTSAVSAPLNTASVNALLTTADGNYVQAVAYRGSLISYASEGIVADLNNVVTTYVGAVSPAGPRAALVSSHNGEDLLVLNTNGAGAFLEGIVPSGAPPEADKTRKAALTPDGLRAVTTNILSDNASIVNLASGAVEAIVPLGDRPADIEITPDGTKAVVANLDSTFASVIDLGAHAVTSIPISTRGSEVEISPDGRYAYVAVVVSDGVWRIDLNTLSVAGPRLTTGNMGGVLYMFNQASGMTLSHDGATLVTCNTFSNSITLIDTASWSVTATVFVGARPVRALFSHDDGLIFVSNRDGSTVSVVDNAGPASSVMSTVAVGAWPFEMALSPNGRFLYVLNFQDDNVGVVDLLAGSTVATIPVSEAPVGLHLSPAGTCLYVPSGSWSVSVGPGPVTSFNFEGYYSVIDTAARAVVQEIVTGTPPAELHFNAAGTTGVVPEPFGEGLRVFEPVPAGLVLAQDPLRRGQPASFTVTGANPGERVHYLYSFAGTGAGPCPAKLGGLCLDLLNPITLFKSASANGAGTAVATLNIPPSAPLRLVHTQAVVRRGAGGAGSQKSNTVSDTIQP